MPSKARVKPPNMRKCTAKKPADLLDLPLELQIMIFKLALDDPVLLDRHHRDGCHLRPGRSDVMAQPPFMSQRVFVDAVYEHTAINDPDNPAACRYRGLFNAPKSFRLVNTWTYCNCAKRRGVNLLAANRHIFHAAAPIFWSNTTFSFFDATEFAACMGATSPGTRALIRSVSIHTFRTRGWLDGRVCLRSKTPWGKDCPSGLFPWKKKCLPAFWKALLLLPGLKHLAIPAGGYLIPEGFHDMDANQLGQARQYLERLGEVDLTSLELFGGPWIEQRHSDRFWTGFFNGESMQSLCGWSRRFQLHDWLLQETALQSVPFPDSLARLQGHEFYVYEELVYFQSREAMVKDTETLRAQGVTWTRPHNYILASSGRIHLWLGETGGFVPFAFYNMPLSKDACARSRLARAKRADEAECREQFHRGSRRRAHEMNVIHQFHALCMDEFRYTTRGIEPDTLAYEELTAPAVEVEAKPFKTKRVRVKKNRRGNKKNDEWPE